MLTFPHSQHPIHPPLARHVASPPAFRRRARHRRLREPMPHRGAMASLAAPHRARGHANHWGIRERRDRDRPRAEGASQRPVTAGPVQLSKQPPWNRSAPHGTCATASLPASYRVAVVQRASPPGTPAMGTLSPRGTPNQLIAGESSRSTALRDKRDPAPRSPRNPNAQPTAPRRICLRGAKPHARAWS